MVKQVKEQMDKKRKSDKKSKELGLTEKESKSEFKSGKFFKAMDKVRD